MFFGKHTHFQEITKTEELKKKLDEVANRFQPVSKSSFSLLSALGCLELAVISISMRLAKIYGFNNDEIKGIIPKEFDELRGDYGLSYIGKILAIIYINTNTALNLDPEVWIKD